MRIGHVALYVNDLEGAKEFFVRYFGAAPGECYHNRTTGFRSYFLTFEGGARLEVMTRPDLDDLPKPLARTGYAHAAFCLGSRQAVDELTARMKTDGFGVVSGPRTTGDGYYESCILGPEGLQIELTE